MTIPRGDLRPPPPDFSLVHDIGLYVSVPLLALILLGLAFALRDRRKQRAHAELIARGERLAEGRVIVHVTRIAPELLRTQSGEDLSTDGAPLALEVGQRGFVLGELVLGRDPAGDTGYREPQPAAFGRLLPVGDRYAVVPGTSGSEPDTVRGDVIVSVPLAGFVMLSVFARLLPAGNARAWVSFAWLILAVPIGGVVVMALVAIVHALVTGNRSIVKFRRWGR